MSRYKVMVDDNFHYMDPDERYEHGVFLTLDEAIAECRRIVDSNLDGFFKPGITAAELYDLYTSFGDDPFVVRLDPNTEPIPFSAWVYAKERSDALTADKATSKTAQVANDASARKAPKSGQGIIIVGARPPNKN
jgi:hypothetical protein